MYGSCFLVSNVRAFCLMSIKNGAIRTPNNPLLHKRVIKHKIVKMNIPRTMKINQRYSTTCRVFIQKNWLNLGLKNKKQKQNQWYLCYFCFCLFPWPFHQPHGNLESNTSTIMPKSSGLTTSGGERTGLDLFKSPIPRERLLFDLSGSFLGNPTSKACLYLADTELAPM